MPTIHVMRGLPASGKTRKAEELLKKPNTFRISRQELRAMMLLGSEWRLQDERLVLSMAHEMFKGLIRKKCDIILDDYNLSEALINGYRYAAEAAEYGIIIYEMDGDVEACIERDLNRGKAGGKYAGPDIIRNLAERYNIHKEVKPYTIYNLDGSVVICDDRVELSITADGEVNEDIFYDPELFKIDVPNKPIVECILADIAVGHEIVIITDRPESTRKATTDWLNSHGIPFNRLIMRENGDSKNVVAMKEYVLETYLDKTLCKCVHDNDTEALKMWKSHDLYTINTDCFDESVDAAEELEEIEK